MSGYVLKFRLHTKSEAVHTQMLQANSKQNVFAHCETIQLLSSLQTIWESQGFSQKNFWNQYKLGR